jgi:cell division protease FtsH
VLNCSDATGADIDKEVRDILDSCYSRATEILAGNRDALSEIAHFLVEKETISGDVFMEILNRIRNGKEEQDDKR